MTLEERRIIWNKRKAMRREAAIRRLAVRAAIGFAFLLTVSNIIFFIAKPVKAKEEKAYIKYYTTIEIKQGDFHCQRTSGRIFIRSGLYRRSEIYERIKGCKLHPRRAENPHSVLFHGNKDVRTES